MPNHYPHQPNGKFGFKPQPKNTGGCLVYVLIAVAPIAIRLLLA